MNEKLSTLISSLDQKARRSLEKAAGLSHSKQNSYVEWEHWLWVLLQNPSDVLDSFLKRSGFSVEKISACLTDSIARLGSGMTSSQALSKWLIQWLSSARVEARLEFGVDEISCEILVYSFFQDENLCTLALRLSDEFSKLDPDVFRKDLKNYLMMNASGQTKQDQSDDKSRSFPALEQYTSDLSQKAASGQLDPVIGREVETRQLTDILMRRRQNNPVIVGEAGVGKTALVEGFCQLVSGGQVPERLRNVRVHALDLTLLRSGAGVRGEFEQRLNELLEDISRHPDEIILFIDEVHTIVGGQQANGDGDLANILKPALARGELRTIGATTWAEYKRYIEKDPALSRRFQAVKVEEPDEDLAMRMLRRLVPGLEKHHGVFISSDAVSAAVILSKRYLAEKCLPDKGISLLDTACARVSLSQTMTPSKIQSLESQLTDLRNSRERMQKEPVEHDDPGKLTKDISDCEQQIDILKKQLSDQKEASVAIQQLLDALSEEDSDQSTDMIKSKIRDLVESRADHHTNHEAFVFPWVDEAVVAGVLEDWTGIPMKKMKRSESDSISGLYDRLSGNIIGQEPGLKKICMAMKLHRSGLLDKNRPAGVFMLAGPSGVGKTETALALAEELFGSRSKVTFINMSEFKEEHKVSMLLGSPPGYVGFGEGGYLTEAVRRKPYSILLLDEFEKAHPGVHDIFYRIFDQGLVCDSEGIEVDFRNCVIILTSNLGARNICAQWESEEFKALDSDEAFEILTDHLKIELLKTFRPSFLGRMHLIPYLPLSADSMKHIVDLELKRVSNRIQENYGASLDWETDLSDWLLSKNNDMTSGVRKIPQILQDQLLPPLSDILLRSLSDGGMAGNHRVQQGIRVGVQQDKVNIQAL